MVVVVQWGVGLSGEEEKGVRREGGKEKKRKRKRKRKEERERERLMGREINERGWLSPHVAAGVGGKKEGKERKRKKER